MTPLRKKIRLAIDEGRILVLGAQVLLGFEFQSVFQPGFAQLPPLDQRMKVVSLGLMMLAIGLLMSSTSFHQIVERGADSQRLHRFITGFLCGALLPFAFGLGLDLYVGLHGTGGSALALVAGVGAAAVALFFWYALAWMNRKEGRSMDEKANDKANKQAGEQVEPIDLHDKIDQLLAESRMVIPGAQALLGFQLTATLAAGFAQLPTSSKYLHLASLGLIALTVVLLMTPAAYHRLAERGEDSERFYRLAARLILVAMATLPLGLCAELFVIVRKVCDSTPLALSLSAAALAFFYGLWFGLPLYQRRQSRGEEGPRPDAAPTAPPSPFLHPPPAR